MCVCVCLHGSSSHQHDSNQYIFDNNNNHSTHNNNHHTDNDNEIMKISFSTVLIQFGISCC